ncbi:MAG: fibrillarin-like rRNA/tRNA 2'-O-methyltransferase [Promethearchaeota archaeon]
MSKKDIKIYSLKEHGKYNGIFIASVDDRELFCTKNLTPGHSIYGEKIILGEDNNEYREWNPRRSKLCAYCKKNGSEFHFKDGISILYLGASSGTTISHISDMNPSGRIYAVEFSSRSMRELVERLGDRTNVIPLLADATQPSSYRGLIPEQVDLIYQDVAQPDQTRILLENMKVFLKQGGHFYIAIKSRSIDVLMEPEMIFKRERKFLEQHGCKILDLVDIEPFSDDHVIIVGKN